jgi:hypothetical protein
MKRFLYMVAALSMGTFASGQIPDLKVSFQCRAEPASRALAELGLKAGMNLLTSKDTENEILIISAKDVSLASLMKRIATVTSGEWHPEGKDYRLIGSIAQRRSERRERIAKRVALLQKTIKEHLAPQKSGDPTPADMAGVGMLGGAKSVYRLLERSDLEAIAGMGPNERLVFSTDPTQTQRAFTGTVETIMKDAIDEHNRVARTRELSDTSDAMANVPDFLRGMVTQATKPIGEISKANLILSKHWIALFAMEQANLVIYDKKGQIVLSDQATLDLPGGFEELVSSAVTSVKDLKSSNLSKKETPIPLSQDSKDFESLFLGLRNGMGKMPVIPEGIKEKVFHPEQIDPLAYQTTDCFLAMAEGKKSPLVASVPDDCLETVLQVMARKQTLEQFEEGVKKGKVVQQVADPDWLLIKPADPTGNRESRVDRTSMGILIRSGRDKGLASLDDTAQYAVKNVTPTESALGGTYVSLFAPGAFTQSLGQTVNWDALRFYGGMDTNTMSSLTNGQSVPLSAFSAYQKLQVANIAYGTTQSLTVSEKGKEQKPGLPEFMRAFLPGMDTDFRTEPTEVLPSGLPEGITVKLAIAEEPFVFPTEKDGTYAGGILSNFLGRMDADSLAFLQLIQSQNGTEGITKFLSSPKQGRLGKKRIFSFTFSVAPPITIKVSLLDYSVDNKSPITSFAKYPDDFQKLIEQKTADLKKSPLGSIFSMMGGMLGGGGKSINP